MVTDSHPDFYPGKRLLLDGSLLTVRYVGSVPGTEGLWLGVEWDDATRGRHSGEHNGVRYFHCLSSSPKAASFIRPNRNFAKPKSFLQALHMKYASDMDGSASAVGNSSRNLPLTISGKIVEEVGFEKISQIQAKLNELRIVILAGFCIAGLDSQPFPHCSHIDAQERTFFRDYLARFEEITKQCPQITELDLSCNVFEKWADVAGICGRLPHLESLRVNGNRFSELDIPFAQAKTVKECFSKLKELSLDFTLLTWDQVIYLSTPLPSLNSLSITFNLLETVELPLNTPNLTTLVLSYNLFTSISDLWPLTGLPSLLGLYLRGNQISSLNSQPPKKGLVFPALAILDLSENRIETFAFISHLPYIVPNLTSLRISNNPVFENLSLDDSHMLTLARMGGLGILNYTPVTQEERMNAELYYLGLIGKELSSTPAEQELRILQNHPRYQELCKIYPPPVINRNDIDATATTENTLGANLITFTFYRPPPHPPTERIRPPPHPPTERIQKIPRSVTPYRMKAIVGRLYNLKPMFLKLIWETGEWDPAGERLAEDDDERWSVGSVISGDDGFAEQQDVHLDEKDSKMEEKEEGKWVEREVELKDGTRQVGFWIEGREARVRVEERVNTWSE